MTETDLTIISIAELIKAGLLSAALEQLDKQRQNDYVINVPKK